MRVPVGIVLGRILLDAPIMKQTGEIVVAALAQSEACSDDRQFDTLSGAC
jgi:hypothetical protein